MKKKIIIATAILLVAAAIITLQSVTHTFSKGNGMKYSIRNTAVNTESTLSGKKIIFLGSSVTYGYASHGNSFVDFLQKRDGVIPIKEAVSGTTLVDNGKKSYVARMKTIDTSFEADAFVCQLSTNDATKNLPLGEVTGSFDKEAFDTQTVAGAMEYIIAYAKETWNCPVVFYTGTKYDSEQYEKMVSLLLEIQKKWEIGVINLWNNPMNEIDEKDYKLYMADPIHPTKAGYREWWLPEFEKSLCEMLK